jgi:histidine triad (HIT) family protein
MDCLFCKFVSGDIAINKIYENKDILAFKDINPQAPIHFLIIPKVHIPTLNDIEQRDIALVGKLSLVASKLAKEYEISKNGYRTIMNCNSDAGQTVFHIHLHMMAGRRLKWPAG